MTVTIRVAGPADVPELADLAAATFGLACPPGMTQDRVDAFIADVLSPERFEAYLADLERLVARARGAAPGVGGTRGGVG